MLLPFGRSFGRSPLDSGDTMMNDIWSGVLVLLASTNLHESVEIPGAPHTIERPVTTTTFLSLDPTCCVPLTRPSYSPSAL